MSISKPDRALSEALTHSNPLFAKAAFAHPSVLAFGTVTIGEGSSFWPYSVIRCETSEVRIGRFSNLQDFSMIHVNFEQPTTVGDYCSITHHVNLHGCVIEDHCLIGLSATIMEGCVIGRGSVVAGHSFLRPGTIIPPGSIVMGTPGKVVRSADSAHANIVNALLYQINAAAYAKGEHRAWEGIDMSVINKRAASILEDYARS